MYNETYDEYIRSILGYPPANSYTNNYQNFANQSNNYDTRENSELESCYPEIYKIVYPMITKKCNEVRGNFANEDIERMTDEIYYALDEQNGIQLNINLKNDVRTVSQQNIPKMPDKKADVKIKEVTEEKRETRQFNSSLRDLIKILLIRELLRRRRPPMRPPMPNPGQRPPMRPPMARNVIQPFNREYQPYEYDIYE